MPLLPKSNQSHLPHPLDQQTHGKQRNSQVLDEPAPQQSDPSVLELHLRGLSRQAYAKGQEVTVRAVAA